MFCPKNVWVLYYSGIDWEERLKDFFKKGWSKKGELLGRGINLLCKLINLLLCPLPLVIFCDVEYFPTSYLVLRVTIFLTPKRVYVIHRGHVFLVETNFVNIWTLNNQIECDIDLFLILLSRFCVRESNLKLKYTKAVMQRCSVKKVFLEPSQNSQGNTFARVSFLIKFIQIF